MRFTWVRPRRPMPHDHAAGAQGILVHGWMERACATGSVPKDRGQPCLYRSEARTADDQEHVTRPHPTMTRVVLVTGANRGIGREVARQLLAHGFRTILTARDQERGRAAAAELGADFLPLDVADHGSVERCFAAVEAGYGRLDVLVNNAAIHYDTWQRAATADLQVVREALEVNLLGAWQASLTLLPLLRASRHGRIVNVSSEAGSLASMDGGPPAYNVSKAALNAFTRMLAGELRRDRILVNAVCPGWVATDMGGAGGRPVAEGAASVLWAVDLPDDGPTGGFYRDGHPIPW